MDAPTTPALRTRLFHFLQRHSRYVVLFGFVLVLIRLSVKAGENYPFSHFPMYGNPDSRPVDYYFITDEAGNPLPVVTLAGDTAPKLKKRLNTLLGKYVASSEETSSKSEVPDDVRAELTRQVLDGFVRQSHDRGTPMPDKVILWKGLIHQTEDGYRETFSIEARN